jgi:hypothetical protein
MLTKITDEFFINVDEIVYIDKKGKDIQIKLKNEPRPVMVSVYTKEGKAMMKVLNAQYRMSMEKPSV